MATISIDEYLRTSYHPDAHFVDDHLEERPGGEFDHSYLQTATASFLHNNEKTWNTFSLIAPRIRVSPTRVRIPDVCLISREAPRERVTQTPPLACIEIISPEDRLPRAARVMDDYSRMGVQNLWLLEPIDRIAYLYKNGTFKIVEDRLEIPNTPIYLDLRALFASVS